MRQPGYDALAELYDETFPEAYTTPLERHVVAAFADLVLGDGLDGVVLDVGCGAGHVAADLAGRGLDVVGIDPSIEMLRLARRHHPELRFVHGDAHLGRTNLDGSDVRAVLARFSLIHVPPAEVAHVLASWAARLPPGGFVAVAGQSTDAAGEAEEFDHRVAPAWRWHPDRLGDELAEAGFDEVWRTVNRPDAVQRFPAVHIVARRR